MSKAARDFHDGSARLSAVDGESTALSLLEAVAYHIGASGVLHFYPPEQAAILLGSAPFQIPVDTKSWQARLSPEDIHRRNKALRRLSWDGAQFVLTYLWRSATGEDIWIEERGQRRAGQGEICTEIDGVFRNVTRERRALEDAAYLARHDKLSGLLNREALMSAATHMAALGQRHQASVGVLHIRLSNLADVNSVYGYAAGDLLITEFARRLSVEIDEGDCLGRMSGADFAIALYGVDAPALKARAARLRDILIKTPLNTPYGRLHGEVLISATTLPHLAQTPHEALTQTKLALQNATADELCFYKPEMGAPEANASRQILASDILDALNQRRLQLAYQPIIDTQTRQLHHHEALLRLRREDGEIMSAGKFIMAAETLGLVHLLDRRALELAATALSADPELQLALNVSAATVKDKAQSEAYLEALKALGAQASRIVIELTETVALDDPATASAFSAQVRELGCAFAIDDFGSGHTTFRNLMAIEAEMIKIDGTLIDGIATDPNKQVFVRMMVDLAQTFSVSVVAEMVDSRADAQMLSRLGVDYLQGFMFGVPSAIPSRPRSTGGSISG